MTALFALVAVGLFTAVTFAVSVFMVSAAIRREEKRHSLTGRAPSRLTRMARWLNGVYVRMPSPAPVAGWRKPAA